MIMILMIIMIIKNDIIMMVINMIMQHLFVNNLNVHFKITELV